MKKKLTYILASLAFLSIGAIDDTESLEKMTPSFVYTSNLQDSTTNESLSNRLKPIKENFKRINTITNWTAIDTKSLWESLEGGEIKYYYQNENLEKIITKHYGEMFQQLTEYYILNGQLSFVYTKHYKYYETFGLENSQIFENRSYFENGNLIYQINNPDKDTPFKGYLIEYVNSLKASFEKYVAGKDLYEL